PGSDALREAVSAGRATTPPPRNGPTIEPPRPAEPAARLDPTPLQPPRPVVEPPRSVFETPRPAPRPEPRPEPREIAETIPPKPVPLAQPFPPKPIVTTPAPSTDSLPSAIPTKAKKTAGGIPVIPEPVS